MPPRYIGVLLTSSWSEGMVQAFRQGLLDAGYSEGHDVVIDWRNANGDYKQVPRLVADLIQHKVELIVADSTIATQAAKRATSTLPIIMVFVSDPVGSGLVAGLAHPGGNVTGLTIVAADLSAKRLQLLKETIPRLTRVAVLWNPDTPFHPRVIEELKAAAPSLSIELDLVSARAPEELDPAFSAASRAHARGLYVMEDGLFHAQRMTLIKLSSKSKLPAIYWHRIFPDEGGLMSYGANLGDQVRRSAGYVDKLLKGAEPSSLPVAQPTKFELVVNLKTATALGLSIPTSILERADEVLQ